MPWCYLSHARSKKCGMWYLPERTVIWLTSTHWVVSISHARARNAGMVPSLSITVVLWLTSSLGGGISQARSKQWNSANCGTLQQRQGCRHPLQQSSQSADASLTSAGSCQDAQLDAGQVNCPRTHILRRACTALNGVARGLRGAVLPRQR
jgi:hypothetical protein